MTWQAWVFVGLLGLAVVLIGILVWIVAQFAKSWTRR